MQVASALPVFNFSLKIVINTAYQLYLKLFPLHLIPISWQIFILLTHYVAMYTSERSANFSNSYEGSTFSPIWKALKLKNQKQRWKYERSFYTRPIYPEEYCYSAVQQSHISWINNTKHIEFGKPFVTDHLLWDWESQLTGFHFSEGIYAEAKSKQKHMFI